MYNIEHLMKIEHAEVIRIYELEERVQWSQNREHQRLISLYQKSIAKQNAARAISLTYGFILKILKKVTA